MDIPLLALLLMSSSRVRNLTYKVHPLAVASILDAYVRRQEGSEMALGTLMGYIDGNCLVISDAFTVLHKENESTGALSIDKEYHKKMVMLKKKVVPTENVVGWFTTNGEIEPVFVGVHSFYSTPSESKFAPTQLLPSPVLLTLDPTLSEGDLNIRVSLMQPTVGADSLIQFHQLDSSDVTGKEADLIRFLESQSELSINGPMTTSIKSDLAEVSKAQPSSDIATSVSLAVQGWINSAARVTSQTIEEVEALAQSQIQTVKKVEQLINETRDIVI